MRHPESPPVTLQSPSTFFRTKKYTLALLTFRWARDLEHFGGNQNFREIVICSKAELKKQEFSKSLILRLLGTVSAAKLSQNGSRAQSQIRQTLWSDLRNNVSISV